MGIANKVYTQSDLSEVMVVAVQI